MRLGFPNDAYEIQYINYDPNEERAAFLPLGTNLERSFSITETDWEILVRHITVRGHVLLAEDPVFKDDPDKTFFMVNEYDMYGRERPSREEMRRIKEEKPWDK